MHKKKSVFKSRSLTKGLSFGLTSGVITTLGMIVGLESATSSKIVVIAGILSIAIADAFSDALGMHISEEAGADGSQKEIWYSTMYTFIAKFVCAMLFMIPFLIFSVSTAVIVSVIVGLVTIASYSWIIAKRQNKIPTEVVGEHIAISLIVISATHFVGDIIHYFFST